ncbi:uncharacterized protein LOC122722194 [Manihot esculenta]|uniref:uncharacterized protein LOC122722194 n=1 Tax=Manihot esculenta TaxID=3983 RepID=UPI001CC48EF9|nr:uncharacterized protein LOC122722194 [Manihot esculenta]
MRELAIPVGDHAPLCIAYPPLTVAFELKSENSVKGQFGENPPKTVLFGVKESKSAKPDSSQNILEIKYSSSFSHVDQVHSCTWAGASSVWTVHAHGNSWPVHTHASRHWARVINSSTFHLHMAHTNPSIHANGPSTNPQPSRRGPHQALNTHAPAPAHSFTLGQVRKWTNTHAQAQRAALHMDQMDPPSSSMLTSTSCGQITHEDPPTASTLSHVDQNFQFSIAPLHLFKELFSEQLGQREFSPIRQFPPASAQEFLRFGHHKEKGDELFSFMLNHVFHV